MPASGWSRAGTDTHLPVPNFVAEKGDYFDIKDGVKQFERLPR
jgi:hypothetical protein